MTWLSTSEDTIEVPATDSDNMPSIKPLGRDNQNSAMDKIGMLPLIKRLDVTVCPANTLNIAILNDLAA